MNTEEEKRLNPPIASLCDTEVKAALLRAMSRVTPRHSLTSREFSIPKLIRDEVDPAFRRYVESYSGTWNRQLLEGFRPSQMWSAYPGNTLPTWPAAKPTAADRALRCASAWGERLRSSARSVPEIELPTPGWGAYEAFFRWYQPEIEANSTFIATLDTLIYLGYHSHYFRPRKSTESGRSGRRMTTEISARRGTSPYCELCWRNSESHESAELSPKRFGTVVPVEVNGWLVQPRFAEAPESYREAKKSNASPLSRRFCRFHNPQGTGIKTGSGTTSPGAEYRRDVNYRSVFTQELDALRRLPLHMHDRFESTLLATRKDVSAITGLRLYVMPYSGLEVDLRRAAYAQARYGLNEKQEAIWILKDQGLAAAQIALRIGMTQRGVLNAIRELRTLSKFKLMQNIRAGSRAFPLWE